MVVLCFDWQQEFYDVDILDEVTGSFDGIEVGGRENSVLTHAKFYVNMEV